MSGAPFHIGRDQFHLLWDAGVPPVLTVASGSEVEFDALDASCGQITADSTVADLAVLDFSRVDQVCGPVFVQGARPGDIPNLLEVRATSGVTAVDPHRRTP